MDYILTEQGSTTERLLKDNKIIAFADDLLIATQFNTKTEVEQVIKQLNNYGLKTNRSKCQYLAANPNDYLNNFGNYQDSIKYLGCYLSFNTQIIRKELKSSMNKIYLKSVNFGKIYLRRCQGK